MKEDIKTLEELLKASKENDMYEGNKYFKSLEYFIKEYQDLKEIEESHRKENGELREKVKQLEEENKTLNERNQYLVKYRAKLEKELYENYEIESLKFKNEGLCKQINNYRYFPERLKEEICKLEDFIGTFKFKNNTECYAYKVAKEKLDLLKQIYYKY